MKKSLYKIFACIITTIGVILPAISQADTVIIIQNHYGNQIHGFRLISSDPYNYQKFDSAPYHITLTFTKPVQPEKSYIKIYNLYGAQMNDGRVTVTGNDMSIELPELSPGRYKVKWKAQCRCEGRDELNDVLRFTVR